MKHTNNPPIAGFQPRADAVFLLTFVSSLLNYGFCYQTNKINLNNLDITYFKYYKDFLFKLHKLYNIIKNKNVVFTICLVQIAYFIVKY